MGCGGCWVTFLQHNKQTENWKRKSRLESVKLFQGQFTKHPQVCENEVKGEQSLSEL